MEPLIDKTYEVKSSLYGDGCRLFQKKFIFPKNYIMTAAFAIVIIYDIICFFRNTADAMYIVVAFLCLVFAVTPWTQAFKSRLKLMEAVKDNNHDTYRLQVFDNYLTVEMLDYTEENEVKSEDSTVKTKDGEFDSEFFAPPKEENNNIVRLDFGNNLKIVENSEMFLIYLVRSVFYIIPKDKISEEDAIVMQKHFQNRLGKNFSVVGS